MKPRGASTIDEATLAYSLATPVSSMQRSFYYWDARI